MDDLRSVSATHRERTTAANEMPDYFKIFMGSSHASKISRVLPADHTIQDCPLPEALLHRSRKNKLENRVGKRGHCEFADLAPNDDARVTRVHGPFDSFPRSYYLRLTRVRECISLHSNAKKQASTPSVELSKWHRELLSAVTYRMLS
jgi:hypothetical protein